MRKHLAISLASLAMASTCLEPASAQDTHIEERAALYLDMQRYVETYLVQLMQPFRRAAGDDQILTQDEVDEEARTAEAQKRSQIMDPFLLADLDADLSVTRTEWQKTRAGQPGGSGGDQFLTWDADKNGVVTIEEIYPVAKKPSSDQRWNSTSQLIGFMMLYAARDGKLTASELEEAGRSAFDRYDTNKDSMLSRDELEHLATD